jgi:hypothetical protein
MRAIDYLSPRQKPEYVEAAPAPAAPGPMIPFARL